MKWQFGAVVRRQPGSQRHELLTMWVADDVAVSAVGY